MASKSQLKTINEILKIEGMTVTAYQLITEIGCIIYRLSSSYGDSKTY